MSLAALPTELLLLIFNKLNETDLTALFQTNRRLYGIASDALYQQNIYHFNGYGIRWAVRGGNKPALLRFIGLGVCIQCGGPPVEAAARRTFIDAGIIHQDEDGELNYEKEYLEDPSSSFYPGLSKDLTTSPTLTATPTPSIRTAHTALTTQKIGKNKVMNVNERLNAFTTHSSH